jgi:hypothetical protein
MDSLQFLQANLVRDCTPIAVQAVSAGTVACLQIDGKTYCGKLRVKIGIAEIVEEVLYELR